MNNFDELKQVLTDEEIAEFCEIMFEAYEYEETALKEQFKRKEKNTHAK